MADIAEIEVMPLSASGLNGEGGGADTVVVRITDENGEYGIGEADAPPLVVKSFIEMPTTHFWSTSCTELLIGRDPLDIVSIWESIYERTNYPGRRGLGIHALSAIDMALHDLVGRQMGKPIYKLMGGARRSFLTPYATIFPGMPDGRTLHEVLQATFALFEKALQLGYRAVKMELLYADIATDGEVVDAIRQARRFLGPDITLMLDFGYRWNDWHAAKYVLDRVEDEAIYFAEAALRHDDLDGHAHLAGRTGIRIAGAEYAATRWEIREWIERGKVAIVQPDINRCGGLTEIRRIADFADLHGVQVIPHGWKTGITAAAGRHFQAATANAAYFEFYPAQLYECPLRRELVSPDPAIINGTMPLPAEPGLGVTLNAHFEPCHS